MTQTVTFPGLGLEFQLNRVAFTILGIPVYWYGILLATGLFCGMLYAFSRAKRVGVDADRLVDVFMGGVVGAIIGARAYYVAFSWDMYKDNLMSIFNLRHGGIAIYGAIIGGILAGILVARWRKVRILPTLDLAAGGFLIGQAIGRWGNFVNVEAFGSNTTSIFGMTGPSITYYLQQVKNTGAAWAASIDPALPVHPTFFYESMWCLVGFLLMLLLVFPRRRFDGEAFLFYLVWYGTGRFFIEGLRTDSLMWGSIRVSQALAAVCVVVCIALWLWIRSRIRKNGEDFLPLYVNTPEGQQVVNGTFYQKAAVPEIIIAEEGEGEEAPNQPDEEEGESSAEMPHQEDK